jgi:hypothetical protein
MAKGRDYKAQRLQNRTRGEVVFGGILDDMRILYEAEAILQNGDRFVFNCLPAALGQGRLRSGWQKS